MIGLRIVGRDDPDDFEPVIDSVDMKPTKHRKESPRAFKARINEAERINQPQYMTRVEIGDDQVDRIISGVSEVVVNAIMKAMQRDAQKVARKAVAKALTDATASMRRKGK